MASDLSDVRVIYMAFRTTGVPDMLTVLRSDFLVQRYFLNRYPHLCILACTKDNLEEPIGCVVGKMDMEQIVDSKGERELQTGYIGMLAVQSSHRRLGIGRLLVKKILKRMKDSECTSVTLETEVSNRAAQRLYQDTFGFIREELLVRYYLNWGDAYRLRLWF